MAIELLVLTLILFILILYIYFYLRSVRANIFDPIKVESLINQLPNISKQGNNSQIISRVVETFPPYLESLIGEGKITPQQYSDILSNLGTSFSAFNTAISNKKIDWEYFLNNYYYPNSPPIP